MKKEFFFILIFPLLSLLHSCEKDQNETKVLVDFDGNSYKTIQIGDQIWMAENLKTTHYANGTAIPMLENETDWKELGYNEKAMCFYNNSMSNEESYGALYNFEAAVNGSEDTGGSEALVQGVCPDGWHLPSDSEWKELEVFLGMSQEEANMFGFRGTNEGSKLAGDSVLWMKGPVMNGKEFLVDNTDFESSHFMALPGGYRSGNTGGFYQLGDIAVFWSSNPSGDTLALTRLLHFYNTRVYRFTDSRKNGYQVRCLKD